MKSFNEFEQNKCNCFQPNCTCFIPTQSPNDLSLLQKSLSEILQTQATLLEQNIQKFREKADQILIRDKELIRRRQEYEATQKKIMEEEQRMNELDSALDYLIETLSKSEYECNESAKVIEDYENITDQFYETINSVKDEQGEVIDLINEIWKMIESIDKKLDILEEMK